MKKIAQNVGFELMNFMDKEEKETKKQISKDTRATLKQQKSDEKDGQPVEPMGESLSKDWWKYQLSFAAENKYKELYTDTTLRKAFLKYWNITAFTVNKSKNVIVY